MPMSPEKKRAYMKEYRRKQEELGRCQCGAERVEGRRYCAACIQHRRNSAGRQYEKRKRHETCLRCGSPREEGLAVCTRCRDRLNDYNASVRAEVLREYGDRCACCGETTPEFLTIDHVNDDGAAHRAVIGKDIYGWLRRNNFPKDGFQILCWNCNEGKRFCGGVCPHQKKRLEQVA